MPMSPTQVNLDERVFIQDLRRLLQKLRCLLILPASEGENSKVKQPSRSQLLPQLLQFLLPFGAGLDLAFSPFALCLAGEKA